MTEPLAIDVRRASVADTEAVRAFTHSTWDGWDYIPRVWNDWLAASDGILLVATPRQDGRHELDRFGRALDPARPVAIARVTLLAESQAWLEGMRVDPGVRGRSVATALQEACLHWAAAQGATTVRYFTGEGNEGSHRLAARHGFRLLRPWRSFSLPQEPNAEEAAEPTESVDPEDEGGQVDSLETDAAPGVAAAIRETEEELALEADDTVPTDDLDSVAPTSGRNGRAADRLRSRLARAGLLLALERQGISPDAWWDRIAADPTLAAGDGLYEGRAWAFLSLTRELFDAHVAAGDVVAVETGSGWALGLVRLRPLLAEDDEPFIGLLVGTGDAARTLLRRLGEVVPRMPRLRLPDSLPLFGGSQKPLLDLGLRAGDHAGHLFERELDPANPPAPVSAPGTLRLVDPPRRLTTAPPVGS